MAVIVREKKKGSGEWWVFINHKGKRRSKRIGSKTAANQVKREIEARLARGDMGMIRSKCPTVAKYGSEWLNSPLRAWSDGTLLSYTDVFDRIIKKRFGSKMLSEIKRRHIKQFISELDSLSSSRKRLILAVLSGIFESALDDELVESNPCQGAQKYCGKLTSKKIVPLTAEEVQTMLENASSLSIVYYTFLFVSARTGLRVGELLGLRWKDINFEERYLEVNRSFYHRTSTYGLPKNRKARKVDLTPATVEALRNLQAHRKLLSIQGDDLVFTITGEPLVYSTLRKKFKTIAPRPIRIHDLRHSYATLRILKNDNLLDVSKQLGHHSVSFTIDRYGHWIPGEHKSQVDELDNLHPAAPYAHPTGAK